MAKMDNTVRVIDYKVLEAANIRQLHQMVNELLSFWQPWGNIQFAVDHENRVFYYTQTMVKYEVVP